MSLITAGSIVANHMRKYEGRDITDVYLKGEISPRELQTYFEAREALGLK